jgi:hypothetical protein
MATSAKSLSLDDPLAADSRASETAGPGCEFSIASVPRQSEGAVGVVGTIRQVVALRTHGEASTAWRLGDTVSVRLHHRWDDDEDRPEPDLTDPATAAALTRAARGVRLVKLIHLALLALGIGLLALALLLRVN